MRKLVILVTVTVLIMVSMLATPVYATGPEQAGQKFVPFNPKAWEHALLGIFPHCIALGTETTIWQDGKTIKVSAIPLATYNEATGRWEGPTILLKWSRAWEAATYEDSPYYTGKWTKQAWSHYYFWLNGYGPVTIKTTVGGVTQTEYVTDFIFFKVQYVGAGVGNSDFDIGRNFDVIIQAYK